MYTAKSLQFEAKPDYDYLKKLLRTSSPDLQQYDYIEFDWVKISVRFDMLIF